MSNLIESCICLMTWKIYDTERLNSKRRKSFLNYSLLVSELHHFLGRRNLASMMPELNNCKNVKSQRVSSNKIKAVPEYKIVVNKFKLYV